MHFPGDIKLFLLKLILPMSCVAPVALTPCLQRITMISVLVLLDLFTDVLWICLCGEMLGCELGTVVESLFIGSYVYHSDVIAGMQLCY